jgi:hypothetical protein
MNVPLAALRSVPTAYVWSLLRRTIIPCHVYDSVTTANPPPTPKSMMRISAEPAGIGLLFIDTVLMHMP